MTTADQRPVDEDPSPRESRSHHSLSAEFDRVSSLEDEDERRSDGDDDGEAACPDEHLPSTHLRRSTYILLFVLVYAALALFAWITTCIMVSRPIGAKSYDSSDFYSDEDRDRAYDKSRSYLKAAQIVQSITSLLTIPLTSAVCSRAAVNFAQARGRSRRGPTLRQSMALADKGWADPILVSKLARGYWKRYASSFLVCAILLNLLGVVISPLQQLLVTSRTISLSTMSWSPSPLFDMMDHFPDTEYAGSDDYYMTVKTREKLASTENTDPQFRLWSHGDLGCGSDAAGPRNPLCNIPSGQHSLGNMSLLKDPFWAQLPTGFSTGLLKQYAPRLNSTAKFHSIDASEFPSDCRQIPGALYLQYANSSDWGDYSFEACMPSNMTQSPWKGRRSRQDFTEELYLDVRMSDFSWSSLSGAGNYTVKIEMDTTAGYFELPNDANGKKAGPLLASSPPLDQEQTLFSRDISDETDWTPLNASMALRWNINKGPLLNLALALFGEGSFLDIQHTATDSYARYPSSSHLCAQIVPFLSLLRDQDGKQWLTEVHVDPCVEPHDAGDGFEQVLVAEYLTLLVNSEYASAERIQNAFTSAAFLSNDVWMMDSYNYPSLQVSVEEGTDREIPHITFASIVVISILLAMYLVSVLALALYSMWTRSWTDRLDSFAMMRIGASIADRLPLRVAYQVDQIKALDEAPGWIGCEHSGEKEIDTAALRLGGESPLTGDRRYHCYLPDGEGERAAWSKRRQGYSQASQGG